MKEPMPGLRLGGNLDVGLVGLRGVYTSRLGCNIHLTSFTSPLSVLLFHLTSLPPHPSSPNLPQILLHPIAICHLVLFTHDSRVTKPFPCISSLRNMTGVPKKNPASEERTLVINGQEFRDAEALVKQIPIWKETLPKDTFEQFLNEGAMFLSEWITSKKRDLEETTAAYMDVSAATRENWGSFKKTQRFSHIWGPLNKKRNYNNAKRENARKRVIDTWKEDGEQFLTINNAIHWSLNASNLAR